MKSEELYELMKQLYDQHAANYPVTGEVPDLTKQEVRFTSRTGLPLIILRNEALAAFDNVLDYLLRDVRVSGSLSRRFLERQLEFALMKGVEAAKEIVVPRRIVREWSSWLVNQIEQAPTRWRISIPVRGLVLPTEPLQLADVTYREVDTPVLMHWSVDAGGKLAASLLGQVLASAEVLALDADKAFELALLRVQKVTALICGLDPRASVVLQGTAVSEAPDSEPIFRNMGDPDWPISMGEAGMLSRFKQLKQHLEPILTSPAADNELKQRLERALGWLWLAIQERFYPDRFVKFVTVLEVLWLTGRDGERPCGLTEEFAANLSTVFSSPGKSPSLLKQEYKRLYGLRSKILHRGDYSRLKEADVRQVEHLTLLSLVAVATHASNFARLEDLLTKIKAERALGQE